MLYSSYVTEEVIIDRLVCLGDEDVSRPGLSL